MFRLISNSFRKAKNNHQATTKLLSIAITAMCILSCVNLSGCIKIYKKDIRQGNHVTQELLNQLRPGMSKEQVQSILGSPVLIPIFNLSRWDYYYSFKSGRNEQFNKRALSFYFKNDKLESYTGDWDIAHLPRKLLDK